jgi:hypothetical protein
MLARLAAFNRRNIYVLYQAAAHLAGAGALAGIIIAGGLNWISIVGAFLAFALIALGGSTLLVWLDCRHLSKIHAARMHAEFEQFVAELKKD